VPTAHPRPPPPSPPANQLSDPPAIATHCRAPHGMRTSSQHMRAHDQHAGGADSKCMHAHQTGPHVPTAHPDPTTQAHPHTNSVTPSHRYTNRRPPPGMQTHTQHMGAHDQHAGRADSKCMHAHQTAPHVPTAHPDPTTQAHPHTNSVTPSHRYTHRRAPRGMQTSTQHMGAHDQHAGGADSMRMHVHQTAPHVPTAHPDPPPPSPPAHPLSDPPAIATHTAQHRAACRHLPSTWEHTTSTQAGLIGSARARIRLHHMCPQPPPTPHPPPPTPHPPPQTPHPPPPTPTPKSAITPTQGPSQSSPYQPRNIALPKANLPVPKSMHRGLRCGTTAACDGAHRVPRHPIISAAAPARLTIVI
jgi:hypothetical protein